MTEPPVDAGELRALDPKPWRELEVIWSLATSAGRERAALPRGSAKVMVIPGFLTSDTATWLLRRRLAKLGHRVVGWGLGLNRGNVESLLPQVRARVEEVAAGEAVHLVGWSLGGYLAREVAREAPASVAQVVTLASPIVGGPKYTSAAAHYRNKGVDLDAIEARVAERDETHPLRTPVTALWSRRDAVVCPASCIDRVNAHVRHVEVGCAHGSFVVDGRVLAVIAECLAAPSGASQVPNPTCFAPADGPSTSVSRLTLLKYARRVLRRDTHDLKADHPIDRRY